MRRLLWLAVFLLGAVPASAQLPVVPGAPLSFGMTTRAAYACDDDPVVIKVTNLEDLGTGSLRAALEDDRPRVVVFEVSGYIDTDGIVIDHPCITVAGQTAPSPGITLRGGNLQTIEIRTNDVLIQHIRVRSGDSNCNTTNLGAWWYTDEWVDNIVFDHISSSWSTDEGVYFKGNGVTSSHITVWRSIMSEGLYNVPCGVLGSGSITSGASTSYIQNLFANNTVRTPSVSGYVHRLNNIVYHWLEGNGFTTASFFGGGQFFVADVGNRHIAGPYNSNGYVTSHFGDGASPAGSQVYRSDNTLDNSSGFTIAPLFSQLSYDPLVLSVPTQAALPVGYSALASADLEDYLLPLVGARPVDRDEVDTRVIAEVLARTGKIGHQLHTQDDVGGYPTLANNSRTFNAVANPNVDSGNGYTNLEIQLHGFAAAVEGEDAGPPEEGPDDVAPAAGAIIVSAAFTGASGLNLTDYTSDTGGGWAFQTGASGILELDASNRLMNIAPLGSTMHVAAGVPLTANYDVAVDAVVVTLTDESYGVSARVAPTTSHSYTFLINTMLDTGTFYEIVAGEFNLIGTCTFDFEASTTYRLTVRVRDESKHAVINSTQCASSTDNNVTAVGRGGLSVYGPTSTLSNGTRFDNFLLTDVTSLPPVDSSHPARLRLVRRP